MSTQARKRKPRTSSSALKSLAALMIVIGMSRAYVSYQWLGVGGVAVAVLVGAGAALFLRRTPQNDRSASIS